MQARRTPGGLRKQRRNNRLRIFQVPGVPGANTSAAREAIKALCEHGRIDIEDNNIQVITLEAMTNSLPVYSAQCTEDGGNMSMPALDSLPTGTQAQVINSLIKLHSTNTSQVSDVGVGRRQRTSWASDCRRCSRNTLLQWSSLCSVS